jgi:hypothetical protein
VTDASRFDRRLIAPMVAGSVLNPINSSMHAVALIRRGLRRTAVADRVARHRAVLVTVTQLPEQGPA